MNEQRLTPPSNSPLDRDKIAAEYFETLVYPPYPVQEEALLAYFTSDEGVLVCAPTGTGKTLIAEAAVYEALRTGKRCYYTTPLIALTDQKLDELTQTAQRWGFPADSVGLVTGNRKVNPDAPILVVVAEILLNRLMHPDMFQMNETLAVVMDEFHCFNDRERGIVWEMSLAFLPKHVRTLLLSATVGNSVEFLSWLRRAHGRNLELVQGTERKVPLSFEWVDDKLLDEQLEYMFDGDDETRRTPTLLFCFNRDLCWQVAELLKGKRMVDKPRQALLSDRLNDLDLSQGAGPKLKAILQRGIGIHHAGILPRYRRIVESLFQEKLLSVCVCTETLSAGINLPARSVVLPTILSGPKERKRVIETSTAHQIFGRAGRPQFDKEGFVYALAHEDDVRYLRWKEKYDAIPDDVKDPKMLAAKKQLKKKMPKRRDGETYWSQGQFDQLRNASPADLASKGELPWRLLVFMLLQSPDAQLLRDLVGRRLIKSSEIEAQQKRLNQMLITLWNRKLIELEPPPQPVSNQAPPIAEKNKTLTASDNNGRIASIAPNTGGLFVGVNLGSLSIPEPTADDEDADDDEQLAETPGQGFQQDIQYEVVEYKPRLAKPTEDAELVLHLRSINPIFGMYMADQLLHADLSERILALESVLEIPNSVAKLVRVPRPDEMPFGPLANEKLHPRLLELGLATPAELLGKWPDEDDDESEGREQFGRRPPPPFPLTLGDKIRRLFHFDVPGVYDVKVNGVWVVGELLEFNGDFFKYITARGLQKQEGILFRHVLRFTMLCDEIASIPPIGSTPENWEYMFDDLIDVLSASCRAVDPESTDEILSAKLENDELLMGNIRRALRRT